MSTFTTSPRIEAAYRLHATTRSAPDEPEAITVTSERSATVRPRYVEPPPKVPTNRTSTGQRRKQPWDIRFVVWFYWRMYHVLSAYPKARAFGLAMIGGFVSRSIARRRLEACATCPLRQPVKGLEYCGGCGCGQNMVSRLDRKARFKRATCPKGRW